eukprot:CAMPEP_0182449134 /NCGR_PEP_ID=MMETSP1172-20130603/32022_1 /TAXON_ID=708627 /ORGANISM="Timspurckia oligopyrenoides, Strain CCMP3278" /LENGTH=172 /DNA_ID=CAMNT_0024646271 /DNA_START=169 /DNA_END=687 /DNA_ORIENTATION=-
MNSTGQDGTNTTVDRKTTQKLQRDSKIKENTVYKCEMCAAESLEKYGSGRFCSATCARLVGGRAIKRKRNNEQQLLTLLEQKITSSGLPREKAIRALAYAIEQIDLSTVPEYVINGMNETENTKEPGDSDAHEVEAVEAQDFPDDQTFRSNSQSSEGNPKGRSRIAIFNLLN